MSLLVYLTIIPYTKFEHFASFVFELCCGQTDKQTARERPTSTFIGNNMKVMNNEHEMKVYA